jgi:hypothetical protein
MSIANAGVALDERRNRSPRFCETEERVISPDLPGTKSHSRNLNQIIAQRIQSRGFQVVNDK